MRKATAAKNRQSGLRALRTASSVCLRSAKPPVQGQRYLDLYVLQRDRARWGQLKDRAEEMIRNIDKALCRLGLGRAVLGELTGAAPNRSNRPTRRPSIVIRNQDQAGRRRMEKVA